MCFFNLPLDLKAYIFRYGFLSEILKNELEQTLTVVLRHKFESSTQYLNIDTHLNIYPLTVRYRIKYEQCLREMIFRQYDIEGCSIDLRNCFFLYILNENVFIRSVRELPVDTEIRIEIIKIGGVSMYPKLL